MIRIEPETSNKMKFFFHFLARFWLDSNTEKPLIKKHLLGKFAAIPHSLQIELA